MLDIVSSRLFAQQEVSTGPGTPGEIWPEIDVFIKLNSHSRLFLLTTRTKAKESPYTEAMFGAHIDFGLTPKMRLILRDVDTSKMHYLSFRLGYNYNRSINDNDDPFREHRPVIELTSRYPLPASLLLSDRNRFDLRWVNGVYSWRYRNRATLEREFKVGQRRALTPYSSAEVYHDSRFGVWNRNAYAFGLQTTLNRSFMIDSYFMRQNDSRSSPPHLNALGVGINLFFAR